MGLLIAYGYPAGNENAGWVPENGYPYTSIKAEGRVRIDFAPMYFVRSGAISIVETAFDSLFFIGANGDYWSATAFPDSTTRAYQFALAPSNVSPSNVDPDHRGYSVRCLAR